MNKYKLGFLGAAAISAYAAMAEVNKEEPLSLNISQLEIPQEDKNRLLYLQTEIREKYPSIQYGSFDSWKDQFTYPEYEDLSPTQILSERDKILNQNGYSLGTLEWHFTGKDNEFKEFFSPTKIQSQPNELKVGFQKKYKNVLEK